MFLAILWTVFILSLGKGGRLRAKGQGRKVFERAEINFEFESILDISIYPFSISLNVSFGIFDRRKPQALYHSAKL